MSDPSYVPEYSNPSHFIMHISDTHLLGDTSNLYDSFVNGDETLLRLTLGIEQSGATPDAIVVTGDIADKGEPEAYFKIKGIFDKLEQRLNTKVIWVMGNHDDRAAFKQILLNQEASYAPVDEIHNLNGLRLIVLDTTVPGHHYGYIEDDQLQWLDDVLNHPAEHGTILALHHPPAPSMLPLAATVELRDQFRLAKVLQHHTDEVKSIIGGHLHYSSFSTFCNIPVSIATSTCYTQDLNVISGGNRGMAGGQGLNFIHVYKENVLHSVVPLGSYSTVGEYVSPERVKEILSK